MVAIGAPRKVVGLHLERLAETSPEIRQAIEEGMASDEERVRRLLEEDPEWAAAFAAALEQNPAFHEQLRQQQAGQGTGGDARTD